MGMGIRGTDKIREVKEMGRGCEDVFERKRRNKRYGAGLQGTSVLRRNGRIKRREIKGAAQLYRERDAFEKEKGEKEAGTLESEVQGGKSKKKRRREFVRKIKRDVLTLYMCFLELPWYKKLLPFFLLCYAFSPLDLIPDFIPVLGLLDDLILLPFGIWVCRKLIPVALWEECAERVRTGVTIKRVYKVIGAILIAIIWGAIVFLVLSACGVF